MRRFDYSFLRNSLLPNSFFSLASGIAALKMAASNRKEKFINIFSELEAIAKV